MASQAEVSPGDDRARITRNNTAFILFSGELVLGPAPDYMCSRSIVVNVITRKILSCYCLRPTILRRFIPFNPDEIILIQPRMPAFRLNQRYIGFTNKVLLHGEVLIGIAEGISRQRHITQALDSGAIVIEC